MFDIGAGLAAAIAFPAQAVKRCVGPTALLQRAMIDNAAMTAVFAGLWEAWRGPKDAQLPEPLLSYTIITTTPNAVAAPIHDRMPVLFTEPSWWDAWLDPKADTAELMKMLAPAADDLLETYPVSRELLRRKELDASILAPAALG